MLRVFVAICLLAVSTAQFPSCKCDSSATTGWYSGARCDSCDPEFTALTYLNTTFVPGSAVQCDDPHTGDFCLAVTPPEKGQRTFTRPEWERSCYDQTVCVNSTHPCICLPDQDGVHCESCRHGRTNWPACDTWTCEALANPNDLGAPAIGGCTLHGTCDDSKEKISCKNGQPYDSSTHDCVMYPGDAIELAVTVEDDDGIVQGIIKASDTMDNYVIVPKEANGLTLCRGGELSNAGDGFITRTGFQAYVCQRNERCVSWGSGLTYGSVCMLKHYEQCQDLSFPKYTINSRVSNAGLTAGWNGDTNAAARSGLAACSPTQTCCDGQCISSNQQCVDNVKTAEVVYQRLDGTYATATINDYNEWELPNGQLYNGDIPRRVEAGGVTNRFSAPTAIRVVMVPMFIGLAVVLSAVMMLVTTGLSPVSTGIPAILSFFAAFLLAFSQFWFFSIVATLAACTALGSAHKGGNVLAYSLIPQLMCLGSVCGGLGFGSFWVSGMNGPDNMNNAGNGNWAESAACSNYFGYFRVDTSNIQFDADPNNLYWGYCSEGWVSFEMMMVALTVLAQTLMIVSTGVQFASGSEAKQI